MDALCNTVNFNRTEKEDSNEFCLIEIRVQAPKAGRQVEANKRTGAQGRLAPKAGRQAPEAGRRPRPAGTHVVVPSETTLSRKL